MFGFFQKLVKCLVGWVFLSFLLLLFGLGGWDLVGWLVEWVGGGVFFFSLDKIFFISLTRFLKAVPAHHCY